MELVIGNQESGFYNFSLLLMLKPNYKSLIPCCDQVS
jgi:hypothetical protein